MPVSRFFDKAIVVKVENLTKIFINKFKNEEEINITERNEIDKLIYRIYQLSKEEIKIFEELF
jgi:hypothetical protein